jgi:hypothetical protein
MNTLNFLKNKFSLEIIILVTVLLIYFIINLITASRSPTIWIDEVMFTDPAANLYLNKGFTSTAWFCQSSDEFWAGYPPLHQLLLFQWLRLFGLSATSVRAINYFYMILISAIVWLATIRLNLIKKSLLRISLIILVLTGYGITFSYRSGRVDTLCILLFSCIFLSYSFKDKFLKYICLCVLGILSPFTGLQLAVYLFLLGILLLLFLRNSLLKEFIVIQSGVFIGLSALLGLYFREGVLNRFLDSVLPRSFLFSQIFPGYSPCLRNNGGESLSSSNQSLLSKICNFLLQKLSLITSDYSSILIFIALILIMFYFLYNHEFRIKSSLVFGLISVPFLSFSLSIIGQTPVYYTWMIFLPAIFVLFMNLEQLLFIPKNIDLGTDGKTIILRLSRLLKFSIIFIIIFASLVGLPLRLFVTLKQWDLRNYDQVKDVIFENISSNDIVFSDFQAYYPVKIRSKKSFYPSYLPIMSSLEKESVSVLVIPYGSLDSIAQEIGGQWKLTNYIQSLTNSSVGAQGYNLQLFRRTN